MKVAIYAGMFKRNQDGATKTLYELTDSLLDRQIEVGVWAFQVTPQKRKGLSLFTIPSIPLPIYPEYKISLPNRELKEQMKLFAPDVLHITVPDMVGISLILFAERMGIPVLTSFHTDFPSYLKSYRLNLFYHLAWKFLAWFYNRSRVVLAPTEIMIQKLKGFGIKRIKLWPRGIHRHLYNSRFRCPEIREQWGADKNTRVILYSGRFVWYKDLETFIRVYDRFKEQGPKNVRFVLAGDGPIRDELESRMPDAIFPGYLQGKYLSQVYACADLLLFPSTTETFGNVVMEALSSGIPAVVSDTGGCREIVERSGAGLVAKAGNVEQFYQHCKTLVENREVYDRCRADGLEYAKNQGWTRINDSVIDEYYRIAREKWTTGYRVGEPGVLPVNY